MIYDGIDNRNLENYDQAGESLPVSAYYGALLSGLRRDKSGQGAASGRAPYKPSLSSACTLYGGGNTGRNPDICL